MRSGFALLGVLAVILLMGPGCSSSPPPRLRTAAEIQIERDSLPILYWTTTTHKEVKRPRILSGKLEDLVDPEAKELLWNTLICTNPDCPGKNLGAEGRPYLFINPNMMVEVGPDGTIKQPDPKLTAEQYYKEQERRGGFSEPTCPECLKLRNRASETPAQRAKYVNFVKEYVLPETEKRNKELDEELKKWYDYVRERQTRKAVKSEP